MRNAIGVAALGALVALMACGGSDGAQGPAGPPGAAGGGAGGDGGPGPSHAPAGVSFEDDDYAQGAIGGTITVQKASDESDVTSYAVYWGSSATDKLDLTPIFEVKTTGQDISFPYEGLVPPGATTLLAFAKNPNGESAAPVASTGSLDHYLAATDVSGGAAGSGLTPAIALDTKNKKVVIATTDENQKLSLFICGYDGTGCSRKDASVGHAARSGFSPSIAIDEANEKIRVVTSDDANGDHVAYYVCNLDGTGCAYTDLSATVTQVPAGSGRPSIAIDSGTNQLWVALRNDVATGTLAVLHCALDATGCAFHNIGTGTGSGENPSIVVDVPGNHLYVGGTDGSNGNNYDYLWACAADSTACVAGAFSEATEHQSLAPSIALDPPEHRLYFASKNALNVAALTTCDTTKLNTFEGCVPQELAEGDTSELTSESQTTSVAYDVVHKRVLVTLSQTETGYQGMLYRCAADGGGCKADSLSRGLPLVSGVNPQIAVDPTTGQFFVAMENRGGQPEGASLPLLVFLK